MLALHDYIGFKTNVLFSKYQIHTINNAKNTWHYKESNNWRNKVDRLKRNIHLYLTRVSITIYQQDNN